MSHTEVPSVRDNVRAEMARRGYTQETTGAAVGLTQFALSRRLRGEIEFSASELQRLADFLKVSVASLYGEVSA